MTKQFGKIVAILMVLVMAVSMFAITASADTTATDDFIVATSDEATTDEYIGFLGDANVDGKVDVRDATAIQKDLALLVALDEVGAVLADANLDGDVNIKDATEIQKWVALLPANEKIGTLVTADDFLPEDKPVVTPDEPVVTPDEPVVTPDEPVVTPDEPVVVEKVVLTFYTAKTGWVADAGAYVLLVDTDTETAYETTFDGENSWTAEVPETVVNIRFDRCDPDTGNVWNSWAAADRGEATTFQTDGDTGVWNDEIAEISEVTIYFDNSVTQWDYVAFYQWSDSSFAQYTVMTQLEDDPDIWTLTINSNITTGLFKGSAVDVWEPILQTANITIDTATYGNDIIFTVYAGAEMWETTPEAIVG
ncbi:MAG: hypothetical protein IJC86_04280 [Clostridia bacterium]|nr:hypothetical protein [Clostridia bacterium]